MNKIKALIVRLGGTVKVADALNIRPATVSMWINRDAIPFHNWRALSALGVSWEELLELHKETAA